MKIQKRKIIRTNDYPRVSCYDETKPGGMRSHPVSLKKCKSCRNMKKITNKYVYCKKITAPYWYKDKVIVI